jgi:hypothetical protein
MLKMPGRSPQQSSAWLEETSQTGAAITVVLTCVHVHTVGVGEKVG